MTLYDDAQALRAALDRDADPDFGLHEYATALITSVESLYEDTPAQRICKLVRDENGLSMTPAALHVLGSVLVALDGEDERWGEKNLPGSPSVTDYAAAVLKHVRRRYSTPGVML